MGARFDEIKARSHDDPEAFWAQAAEQVHWEKKWDKVLDDTEKPAYRWFVGGELNTCYNALDIHVDAGRGEQAALSDEHKAAWLGRLDEVLSRLDEARKTSPLPEQAPNEVDIEQWLIGLRVAELARA